MDRWRNAVPSRSREFVTFLPAPECRFSLLLTAGTQENWTLGQHGLPHSPPHGGGANDTAGKFTTVAWAVYPRSLLSDVSITAVLDDGSTVPGSALASNLSPC